MEPPKEWKESGDYILGNPDEDLTIIKYLNDPVEPTPEPGAEHKGKLVLIRRASDGEILLGEDLDATKSATFAKLFETPATADLLTGLLNHENLVSIAGVVRNVDLIAAPDKKNGGAKKVRKYLVWDYCDAGSLQSLLLEPPVDPLMARREPCTGFLPESLCWHVVVSLLRALAWLHDGFRDDLNLEYAGYDPEYKFTEWTLDGDWLPVLHRGIDASNVLFQQPRGSETYGLCKLADPSNAVVAGHANQRTNKSWPIFSHTGPGTSEEVAKLRDILVHGTQDELWELPKDERPYTRGSELYAVGALLYEMMTGDKLPDPEADHCPACGCEEGGSAPQFEVVETCEHDCCSEMRKIANMRSTKGGGRALLARYTDYRWGDSDLTVVVGGLLQHRRSFGDLQPTSRVYKVARESWQRWLRENPEGRNILTLEDDLEQRFITEELWRLQRQGREN